MRVFDYSFLNNGLLPASLVNLTASIASLKTMAGVRKDEYTKIFTELEAIAKVQSVKGSNAIEGIVTSDERINAIVNQNSAPLNHNEAEIAGYRDALNTIHLHYANLDFRQSDILRLHEMMMSHAGYEYGGQYKTDDNVILEVDAQGQRRVRFRPTPAAETPQAMEQLELAYLEARSDANINQLLLIPCVILDFLCIHPFRDGNGRMSRLLSLLLLYKNGYDAGKYVSFEEQINNYSINLIVGRSCNLADFVARKRQRLRRCDSSGIRCNVVYDSSAAFIDNFIDSTLERCSCRVTSDGICFRRILVNLDLACDCFIDPLDLSRMARADVDCLILLV